MINQLTMKIIQFSALVIILCCGVFTLTCAEPANPPAQNAPLTFDSNRAFDILKKQCEFGPRPPGSEAHKKTRDYLFSELKKYTDVVTLQPYTSEVDTIDDPPQRKTLHMNNIIAEFGSGHSETLLLAAHWDTRPCADQDPDIDSQREPILGANDGASGVAVLLEIARILKQTPPPRRLIIILFDGEDYGKTTDQMFLGSRYFAKNMGKWRPDYGILLDMIGDKNLEIPKEQFSLAANPVFMERIWKRAEKLGLVPFQDRVGPAVMDDHVPLIRAGVPMVNLIDFDYPHWHTLEDTVDKCSPKSLEIVGRLVVSIIYEGL